MPPVFQDALATLMVLSGIGGIVAVIMRLRHAYGPPGRRSRAETAPDIRLEALRSNERLALEKLEVLKHAINMGWDDQQLKALDARLEQLVGRDTVARIASGGELPASDLESMALTAAQELERLRRTRSGSE